MRLANKLYIIFIFFTLAFTNYAQSNSTVLIIHNHLTTFDIYLNGSLLNNNNSYLRLNKKINISKLESTESSLYTLSNNKLYSSNFIHKYQNDNSSFFNLSKKNIITDNENLDNMKFDFTKDMDEEFFYDKTIFKVLIGSLVALGATTAYFKIKADKRFQDYKKTNNQSLLDDTDRFDAISGVTFTLMQINLGVLIYYFLKD